jgi:hypothetical protein
MLDSGADRAIDDHESRRRYGVEQRRPTRTHPSSRRYQKNRYKGEIPIRCLSSVSLDDRGTRRWHLDNKAIRFEHPLQSNIRAASRTFAVQAVLLDSSLT